MHKFGQSLVSILIHAHHSTSGSDVGRTSATLTAAVLQSLLEEFHTSEAMERIPQLNAIVATYVALCRLCDTVGEKSLHLCELYSDTTFRKD
jgi:hypothetical protein